MPGCSVCSQETNLHVNGVPICPDCDKAVIGNEEKSFAQVSEALTLARQEYRDALDDHSKVISFFGLQDPRNPAATESICAAYARLDAASFAYEKALRDFNAIKRRS